MESHGRGAAKCRKGGGGLGLRGWRGASGGCCVYTVFKHAFITVKNPPYALQAQHRLEEEEEEEEGDNMAV